MARQLIDASDYFKGFAAGMRAGMLEAADVLVSDLELRERVRAKFLAVLDDIDATVELKLADLRKRGRH